MRVRNSSASLLMIFLLLVGCRSIQVEESRKSPTAISAEEAVTVILNFSSSESSREAHAAEEKFSACVTKALRRKLPHVRIVPADEFRSAAFPGFDIEAAPRSPESFALLMKNPEFQVRIAPLGIRYLVIVGGGTETRHDWGFFECGGGERGGGCLGLMVWEKTSRLAAVVLDLKQGATAGEVSSAVTGHPWFGMLLIFPLGLPSFTEGRACKELGEAVERFISGGAPRGNNL